MYESNTMWKRVKTENYARKARAIVEWTIPNIFTNGIYSITVTAADKNGAVIHDWLDGAASFTIDKDEVTTALALPSSVVKVRHEG